MASIARTSVHPPASLKNSINDMCRYLRSLEQAEEQQRVERDRLERIMEAVPVFICSFQRNPDGSTCLPFATPRIKELYGISPEQLAKDASPIFALIHPDDLSKVMGTIEESANKLSLWHIEYRLQSPCRDVVWVEGCASPVRLADGTVLWHGYLADVTNRYQLEQQFRQSQKMEAVGRLAGGIAHDFNNLLTVINGYSELLSDELEPSHPNYAPLVAIQEAGNRAADLTRQLLAFSRKSVVEPKRLDLNEAILRSQNLLRRLIGADIELNVTPCPTACLIKADPSQIDQVIMNLALNSRDAMPSGGTLTLETALLQVDAPSAHYKVPLLPGRYVRLTVRDTGCGIDSNSKIRMFEPFYTTKEHGKGTGLGLAVVHGIVEQSSGQISVDSEIGKGTAFHLFFREETEQLSPPDNQLPSQSTPEN